MGCGCKDKGVTINMSEKKEPTFLGILTKVVSTIVFFSFIVILTPLIVILIWWFGLNILLGSKENPLSLLIAKYKKGKIQIVNEEIGDVDNYELMDVDVIKK